jgi:hypothetical protein
MNPKLFALLSCIIFLPSMKSRAQETEPPKENYTPYELMSSYYDKDFNPFKKRNVFIGFSFSLEDKRLTNSDVLFKHVIDGSRLKNNIELKGGYYTGNYGMTGLTFDYFTDKLEGQILASEGVLIPVTDTVQSVSKLNGYAVSPYFRSTIPVTSNDRLSFFTEFSFTFGGSKTTTTNTNKKGLIDEGHESSFNFNIGLSPGITFFAFENFALEGQLNVLGYSLDTTKKSIDNEPESTKTRQNVNFNINLLSLRLGLAYYFGAKQVR